VCMRSEEAPAAADSQPGLALCQSTMLYNEQLHVVSV